MSLHVFSLEQKLEVVERLIITTRNRHGADQTYEILKAIGADLRASLDLPKSNTLGELDRALYRVKTSKTALGYDEGKMVAVANVVIHKWPHIRMALEQFGDESAE
jgi:hypothetical protein